jgi:putative phosphoesterase
MLVGVVSDTHGYLDPRVAPLLEGVDHILHAGDIGDAAIIDRLATMAPVTTVRGNNDKTGPESLFPEEVTLELGGCLVYLTHAVKVPKTALDPKMKRYMDWGASVVVSGHSHIPLQKRVGPVLFFNPGAAGKRRFKLFPSVGRLHLLDGEATGTIIPLDD